MSANECSREWWCENQRLTYYNSTIQQCFCYSAKQLLKIIKKFLQMYTILWRLFFFEKLTWLHFGIQFPLWQPDSHHSKALRRKQGMESIVPPSSPNHAKQSSFELTSRHVSFHSHTVRSCTFLVLKINQILSIISCVDPVWSREISYLDWPLFECWWRLLMQFLFQVRSIAFQLLPFSTYVCN